MRSKIYVVLILSGILSSNALAAKKNCYANYMLDNARTIVTGEVYLGQVGGTFANKKKKCKQLAIQHCAKSKSKLLDYAPVGSANMKSLCDQGRLGVYFDSRVEGKKNSKDGVCYTPIKCTRPPCEWTGYSGLKSKAKLKTKSGIQIRQ